MMRVTVVPAWEAPGAWFVPASSLPVRIPAFDEDEVTLAVDATRRLLALLPREAQATVRIPDSFLPGQAAAFLAATGLSLASTSAGPLQLVVDARAPGPGRAGAGEGGAYARVEAPNVATLGHDVEHRPTAQAVSRDLFDRMARWEREAPQRSTMGAYVPRATWERMAGARSRLEASRCDQDHVEFPPRPRCSRCRKATHPHPLPRGGVVDSFTVVAKGAAPSEFEPLQEVVGDVAVILARFGPVRVPGLVADTPLDRIRIGVSVEPVFRRLYALDGEWRYGAKFREARPDA